MRPNENKFNYDEIDEKDLFKSFFDYSLDLFCIANKEGYFVKLNPKWTEVLGFSLKKLYSKPFLDFIHPDDRESTTRVVHKLFEGKQLVSFLNRYRTKDKKYKWFEWSARFIESENVILASAREVSDRIHLQDQINENEYLLNILIKYSPAAVALLDKELKYIYVSQRWCTENNKNEKDVLGKNVFDIFPLLGESNDLRQRFENSLNGKVEKEENYKLNVPDGKPIWFNWEIRPWNTITGHIGGVFTFSENITDKLQNIEKLKSSEKLLNEAQKLARIGSWEFDLETGKVNWSDGMFDIFNLDRSAIKTIDLNVILEMVHPKDRERFIHTINQSKRKKDTIPIDYRIVTRKGEIKYVFAKGGSVLNENKDAVKFFGTLQDVTDQKLAEQAILNSEKRFRSILESAPDAILIVNQFGKVDLTNERAEKLFGYPKDKIKNQDISLFLLENSRKEKPISRTFFQLENFSEEDRIIELIGKNSMGEKFPAEVGINPYETNQGIFFNMSVRDISERKNAETILKRKTEELELKNKELEQFAFVASHDLQEPLRTISSFVELLELDYKGKLDGYADKYIHFILDASERMRVLIKNLLDYSRIGRSQDLERIDCNIIVKNVLEDLSSQIMESDAKITVDKLPIILGHELEMIQLFQNLISNAIKFMKKEVKPIISIHAEKENQFWKFSVSDNGIGMEAKYKEKIFIIFQRLHSRDQYPGTGIGLAHCKKIVELHGGEIWVVTNPDKGSTFYFTIKA